MPNVGKSTLFKALTGKDVPVDNFPYTTTQSERAIVEIPDSSLWKLSELEKPQKTTPNHIEFIDIAGLAAGASKGEGLGNSFLDTIRHSDAIVHIVRCFDDDNIIHVHNRIDPVSDKEEVDFELLMKDLETVEKSLERNRKAAKSGDKQIIKLVDLLERIKEHLEKGGFIRQMELSPEEQKQIKSYSFLTAKKVLYVANVKDENELTGNLYTRQLEEIVSKENASMLILNAKLEAEICDITDEEEKKAFMQMYNLT
ncbi:MAG: redox-regulated ATPase YchF, partial [Calditrichaeota bacterium]